MRLNAKAKDYRLDTGVRVAGGYGASAATQDPEALLRRAVMACLLWEDMAYESGASGAENIAALVPLVPPRKCYTIAVEARRQQKLRHVPLYIAREMARHESHRSLVGLLLSKIIMRPDEITEYVAMYWKDDKQPLSNQSKVGLAAAFNKFDEYAFAKWNRGDAIKLRDVMFLVHPDPKDQVQAELFKKIAQNELETPDTWEVELSASQDKEASWTRLIEKEKLGALAFVRNLRNMEQAGVSLDTIRQGFEGVNPRWLLPINYVAAAQAAPQFEREIESLMLRGLAQAPKLTGHTIFVVDVSGSMTTNLSGKSQFTRMDAAAAMAMLAAEMCESISIYATAGSDRQGVHATSLIPPRRGFALRNIVLYSYSELGGGGIFTRQCLDAIRQHHSGTPERIIVFSDSQDCDRTSKVPSPFGEYNYIVDVSAHGRGINYDGVWTAEIAGWSEHFLKYIYEMEHQRKPQAQPQMQAKPLDSPQLVYV